MLYNVATTVIALVEAETPEKAQSALNAAVERVGFVLYDGDILPILEAEDQSQGPDTLPPACPVCRARRMVS
jgi:hypothetical protein